MMWAGTVLDTPFEIKHLAASGAFAGYASTHHVDSHNDQMMPGAFTYTLRQWEKKQKWPWLLWHHRIEEPIGFWTKMSEDERGLYVEGQLMMDLQRAREAYILLKTHVLEGLSIGFQAVIARIDPKSRVRKIYQVNLIEISIVGIPANCHAHINHLKKKTP